MTAASHSPANFRRIEAALAATGRAPESASLEEMEALWQEAKEREAR